MKNISGKILILGMTVSTLILFQNFSFNSNKSTADIISQCGQDDVNDDMLKIKWNEPKADGSRLTKGWTSYDEATELKSWYDKNPDAPNIYRYSGGKSRTLIQTPSGYYPSFWMANFNNHVHFSPQVMDILKNFASDTIVIRPSKNETKKLDYSYYANATTTSLTPASMPTDFRTLYSTLATKTVTSSGVPRIILGYDFTTKAVMPTEVANVDKDKGEVSGGTEGIFALFKIKTNPKSSQIPTDYPDSLFPSEYVIDPDYGGTTPLRQCIEGTNCTSFKDDIYWVNYGTPSASDKVANQALRYVNEGFGISGMATDGTHYDPLYSRMNVTAFAKLNLQNPRYVCEYKAGIRAKQIKNSKAFFTLFNLLEPGSIDQLNEDRLASGLSELSVPTWRRRSEELLQYSHGGLVEFFGGFQTDEADPWKTACGEKINESQMCDPVVRPCLPVADTNETCDPATNFNKKHSSIILDAVREWRRNPEKAFMIAGRGPKYYQAYADDFSWQEYLHALYLLGAGSNTAFKYLSLFQFPSGVDSVRADGLQLYDNQLVQLGNPKKQYDEFGNPTFKINKTDGIYWRQFDRALVMVNPHDATSDIETIGLKSLAPADVNWSLVPKKLKPGESFIATSTSRLASVGRLLDFRNPQIRDFYAQNPTMEAAENSLRVKETTPAALTDILLNPVKYKTHGGFVKLDLIVNGVRSSHRVISMMAEVDDERTSNLSQRRTRALFELWMGPLPAGMKVVDEVPSLAFRIDDKDPSKDNTEFIKVMRIPNANNMVVGSGVIISFGPNKLLESNGLSYIKFRRWDLIRFAGDYSLRSISIGDSNYITSANGL